MMVEEVKGMVVCSEVAKLPGEFHVTLEHQPCRPRPLVLLPSPL